MPCPADPPRPRRRRPPPLADAFAASLAAEQHEPIAGPRARVADTAEAPLERRRSLGEDASKKVTRRVLDRLSDRVVRETVADLVSSIAERLVREEIERIKAIDQVMN